jgi:hypothetical protein
VTGTVCKNRDKPIKYTVRVIASAMIIRIKISLS